MANFGDFQSDLYLAGLSGQKPRFAFTYHGLERRAEEALSPEAFAYVAGSAGTESTAWANRRVFERWQIVPRMLRGVEQRNLAIEVCGSALAAPVLLAPIGAIGIVHPEAELAVAAAAAAVGVGMVLSTLASTPMEDVAAALAAAGGTGWFQLYWPKEKEVAVSLVNRAERAGYRAIVVTLDTWALAWRPRDLQHGYLPMLTGAGLANYFTDPAFCAPLARSPQDDPPAAVARWASLFGNPGLSWADIAWLGTQTSLPVLVKGVCHPDDARAAIDAGVSGIIVSNHGGRQIDGARPALDCLPDVCAVAGDTPVLFDSGIRTGSDIVKALALGARAVLLGRPYVFGLAAGGADGVEHVLRCLLADLDLTMALSGYGRCDTITRECLVETAHDPDPLL